MYSRIKKRQVTRTITDRDGKKTKKKEWRYYPTIMWQGQELGLGSCRTREDAENVVNRAKSNIAKGLHPKAKDQSPTIQEQWDDMLDTAEKTGAWRQSTKLTYVSTYNLDIKKEFGKKRLSDVTRADVQRWVNKLCAKKNGKGRNIAPASVDRPYRLLRHIFNQAVDNDYIPKNPCIRIKKPSQNKRNIDCLTLEEIESVLEKMDYQQ
ncbi:MAG: phage integrase SAM-like domain-containing protein, partial [Deltaproteobacteria bacterium]|nr:phage integrase SAM-like domain-containing protein [Deltaproteobacteria bacterium]